jgi:4-alpha-glucanotransferase
VLDCQWQQTRQYAKQKGVKILGDIPIYPDPNSFDVFNNPECFLLDKNTYMPLVFGGVPKDEFCEDGQNWGTCVYDWEYLEKNNFKYIIDKINLTLQKYDILRLDHFFGYVEHYEHSATKKGEGQWVKGGGEKLFEHIAKNCDLQSLVIEDLGLSKQEAEKVKNQFNLKGMCVVQMIMESNENLCYLPQNVPQNCIYYLGTHDNNTFVGYLKNLKKEQKSKLCKLMNIKYQCNKKLHIKCMQKMLESKSGLVVVQIQDLLCQDGKSRMNVPGQAAGCWEYKMPKIYSKKVQKTLAKIGWK